MRTHRLALCIALGLISPLPARAAAHDVSFTIRDRLAIDEVAEVTTIYVDGNLVRSFRLDSDNRDVTIPVTVVDDGEPHHYSLCGHILVREPDGHVRTQGFAVGGLIADVADRSFEAYASDNFTRFFLLDTTAGRTPTKIQPNEINTCTPAIS